MVSAILYVAHNALYRLRLIALTGRFILFLFHHYSKPGKTLNFLLYRLSFFCKLCFVALLADIFSAFSLLLYDIGEKNMSIFAIADLHLSTLDSTNKSMEVFGRRWTGYTEKLRSNWQKLITDSDTVIIPGDISWALTLEEARSDLLFLESLPGKKILGKGNHDFWWCTMKKHTEFFEKNGIRSISFLFNNAYETDEIIIAGTRGWYHDEDATGVPDGTDFEKLTKRETLRLKTSLEKAKALQAASPEKEIAVFTHFPPFWSGKESESIVDLLVEYGIKRLFYGHIHGNYTIEPRFIHKGIEMSIISADYLDFIPKIILPK